MSPSTRKSAPIDRSRLVQRRKMVGLTQGQLAERMQLAVSTIGRWERGERTPAPRQRPRLARALDVTLEELQFILAAGHGGGPATDQPSAALFEASTVEVSTERQGDSVDRREFLGLAGTTIAGVVVSPSTVLNDLAVVLVEPTSTVDASADLSLRSLAAGLAYMKTSYQKCDYETVSAELPELLDRMRAARQYVVGDERLALAGLTAQTLHVAASVLLKLDGQSLASVAADRSMEAARQSEDPREVGASARIVTHALMGAGQHGAAHRFAVARAAELPASSADATPDLLSVYGSLLLRGAIAAGLDENGSAARAMLDEAADTADRLGGPGNHHWTAFSGDNVFAHRAAVEISLGNAGTAIEHIRRIQLDRLGIDERRATVCLDASRAYTQWGKFDLAVSALGGAAQISPQEVRVRPAARSLVQQIRMAAPATARADLDALVDRVGIAA